LHQGDLFQNKLCRAQVEAELHSNQHATFCKAVPSNTIDEWETMIACWEVNKGNPDPYVVLTACKLSAPSLAGVRLLIRAIVKSQAAIRLELIEAERMAFTAADMHESSPSMFVVIGMELEEAQ
jgi:hypothetical protein